MNLDELSLDFDVNKILEGIKDGFFKIVRTIFTMFFGLPMWIKITMAVIFILVVIGIAILTWKYRNEWRYVKY